MCERSSYISSSRLTYDYATRHDDHNLLTTLGLLLGIQQVLRLSKTGLLWLGVPCNSFGFMSSNIHKRSSIRPLGDEGRGFVQQGNVLATRAALLALLGLCRGNYYFVENPLSSLLLHFPYFKFVLALDRLGCKLTHGITVRWWLVLDHECTGN